MTIDTAGLVARRAGIVEQIRLLKARLSKSAIPEDSWEYGEKLAEAEFKLELVDEVLRSREALTAQAAVPGVEPSGWMAECPPFDPREFATEDEARDFCRGLYQPQPRYSAAQLSAMRERAEKAEYELSRHKDALASRPDYEVLWAEQTEQREAAEARVAELDALVEKIERLISYPVDTSIDPRGYSTFGGGDRLDYAMELIRARAALHQQDGGK